MIAVTIASTKGGVGKTTLTANFAAFLADLGQKVLMIDADPQPTLSSYFPLRLTAEGGLVQLMLDATANGVISQTEIEGLDLIYSNDPEGKLWDWIRDAVDGRVRLKHLLQRPAFANYDFIFIDTQGAVGPLQDAAVAAADLLLSPIPPELLSAREFVRGTVAMLDRLRPMAYLGAPIGPLRGVIYRKDRTTDARRIVEELRSESYLPSKGSITILDTVIPASVVYREAATFKTPVHRLQVKRRGNAPSALEILQALTAELFPHLRKPMAERAALRTEGI
ncbi:ParA family protein [Methyloterricola oryzae]|uniref:ParA family protein n=1 Tax=Methyloterricola oryzae TaxID=1495050 RepID=UPI000A752A1D|nr:ParA family protein [Methyloterricola oryzae]